MLEPRAFALPLSAGQEWLVFHGPDGELVVSEPSGRWAVRASAGDAAAVAHFQEAYFFQQLVAEARQPAAIRFTVYAALDAIYKSADLRDGVDYLLGALGPRGRVRLLLHFAAPPPAWHPIASWLADLAERYPDPAAMVRFALEGPFDPISEPDMRLLHQAGCRLGVVAGWPAGSDEWRFDVIREFARFGFRALLICYVNSSNIASIPDWIEEGCEASEHSGFSLPLVFQHPAYTFAPGEPTPPEAEAYISLLLNVYRNYPHYDDVFQPIVELTEAVAQGGWCHVRNIPTDIRMLATPRGVSVFRQIPAQAQPWAGWDKILVTDPALLGPHLLAAASGLFAWKGNAFCRDCCWRFVCGGIDAWPGGSALPSRVLRVGCEYRKLFLPELLSEKGRWTADTLALMEPAPRREEQS